MKKVLITFLSHVVPTVVLLGLIVFFWKSHTYLIDIPDKIFNPATLHINPIGPKSIIEYMGVWRVLLLGLFVVLAFYFALAFLFRIKIYGNKQFPRKILLGFFLIALGVAAIFGPFIVANIKSTETQKSICSELEQRHDRAVKIMKKLEQNLINKKPDIETINRFFSSNSFDLIANSLSEYNKVISQYEDSVNALRAIYKQVDTLVAVLKTCKCVASEILINLPGFHSPDPDLANYLSERMDKTLSDNRKSWNLDEWWKFLSARYFIGRYSIVYNTERVKFYCELGDSFYKRSQVSAGDQCYKIAAVSMPAEVVKHLNVSLASPILKYHSQILSIIDREKEYSRNLGDFYDAMGAQVFIYYMEANTASFYGKDSLAYEGLGSQSFKILLDQNFAEAMRVLHGKFIYRGSAVPLIKNRVTSLVSLIKNRVTGDDAFKNPTYASDSYFESLNTFAESGELIITKELWSLAVDLDFHYYPLHSSENVITQGMLREEHDMKMCFLRLFGDEIVYDPVKMAWIQRNVPEIETIILSDQREFSRLLDLGTRIDDQGKIYENPLASALAVKGTNAEQFKMYKQQLWDKITIDNYVAEECWFFSDLGDYMVQFNDTTAVRLAISDYDNAIAFWTESYGGWWVFGKKHSNKEALLKFIAKKSEAISKLALLRESKQ